MIFWKRIVVSDMRKKTLSGDLFYHFKLKPELLATKDVA